MSASNEWTEWHLTPRGWERGSDRADVAVYTHRDPPVDRVLTFTYREYMSSMYSKTDVSFEESWRGTDEEGIAALLNQFGEAPRSL